MRNDSILFLITFFCACVLMNAAPVAADHEHSRDKYMAKKQAMMEKIFKELDLSGSQQAQIKQNREAQKALRKDLKGKIRAKRTELRAELEKEDATMGSVDAIANELITLMGLRVKSRIEGVWAVKQILSPEQFKMLQQKEKKFNDDHK